MSHGTPSEFPGWYVNLQAAMLMQLPRPGQIDQAAAEVWCSNQSALKDALATALIPRVVEEKENEVLQPPPDSILRLISGSESLTIDAVDGTKILADANDEFAWIDSDFKNWGADEVGPATEETLVDVHEMTQDGTFSQLFSSLSTDVRKLCLTQAQIKNFVKKHRDWLRTDGYATFFLFESNGQVFVANVSVYSGGELRVRVRRFEGARVWRAGLRPRVVVPQLA